MKGIQQLILIILGSFNLSSDILQEIEYIRADIGAKVKDHRPFHDRIRFFQETYIAANELGFCIYPAGLQGVNRFVEEYLNTIGIDERYHSTVNSLRLQTGFKHINAPTDDKIPYNAHMVWLTHPDNPKEMLQQNDRDFLGYEAHLNVTIKTLRKYNFTITLWVNSIDLIPATKKWADSRGILVRELKEFEGVKEFQIIMDEINLSIEHRQFAAGADIARLLVVYVYGGLYVDQDHEIIEYDPILHKMNLFLYYLENTSYRTVENSLFGAAPKNAFINKYLMYAIRNGKSIQNQLENTVLNEVNKQYQNSESFCMKKSHYNILYETGPYAMSRVFNNALLNGELDDQLYVFLDMKIAYNGLDFNNSKQGDKYYDIVFNDKTHRLNVRFKHFLSFSWFNSEKELSLYGWQK